jgi:hypothetical protein
MPATAFDLAQAIQSIGPGRVFMGDPTTIGGMLPIPTQGEIAATMPQNMNPLTAPELTGDVPHDAWITPGQPTVTVPAIYGGEDTLARFSATGSAGDGFTSPKKPVYTSLAIFPLSELSTDDPPSIGFDGTDWTPGAPVHALWFWKCVPIRPDFRLAWDDGGKIILPVTFNVFYDATKPVGIRIFAQGDPFDQGFATLKI